MKMRIYSSVESGVFRVVIRTEDWSQGDKTLMSDFGQPQIDLGGTFSGAAPEYLTFSLPNDYVNVMTDSPFQQMFDSRDTNSTVAAQYAEIWKATMVERIQSAVLTLRTIQDTFTDEEIVSV